jgi:meso-butanediol dehydrogenase/(S,S)-butanediol dehydrogenase/diacetyl reductase
MTLEGKVALVTGAGRGIGRGIALALARAGADVALSDIDVIPSAAQHYGEKQISGFQAAEQTAAEVREIGRRAVALCTDVTVDTQVRAMLDKTVADLGGLDILVCNAGVVHVSAVEQLSEEAWDLTMTVNTKGVFLCCRAALPHLRQRSGSSIINIASIAGKNGTPGMAHYCASKFAVVGFSNSLAKEVAGQGIRVNAICPGILDTQMWKYLSETFKAPGESREEAWQRYVRSLIPLGRPQTPEDIGQLAVYLATAPNVTGQAINLDGGMELH